MQKSQYDKICGETYQVADNLSDKVIITHDVVLRRLAISNICQYAQSLTTKQTKNYSSGHK